MKKLILVLVFSLALSSPVYAAADSVAEGMVNKAVRGAVNIVTGVVEIPMQIYKGYDKGFPMIENTAGSKTVGTILGFFRGFGHAAGRITWGGIELFGFWTANREDNEGIGVPFDAQYPWEMGEQHSYFKPTLKEGLKPIPMKLGAGLGDGILGILEVPSQIRIGVEEGNVIKGVGKGVWFWWSRMWYGFGNIYTCLVPNSPDNPGYAFSGDWAWSGLSDAQ